MSELATEYYQQRADMLGLPDVPPILNGEPVNLFTAGDTASLSEAMHRAVLVFKQVEPFVIAGVPEVCEALGKPLVTSEWKRIQGLDRDMRNSSVGAYAARQLLPLAAQVLLDGSNDDGTPALWLEAVTRDQLVMTARKRVFSNSNGGMYADRLYEPSQAFLVCHSGAGSSANGYLTTVQGTYHSRRFQYEKEALTPRYFGARLLGRELRNVDFIA